MNSTRVFLAGPLAGLLVLASLLGGGAPTQAATEPAAVPETVTAQPLPTWQTDGVVYAVEAVGSVVYVGGNFTSVRPPGAPAGTEEVPRKNVAAFDADSGQLLDFSHTFTSPDLPVPAGGYDKTCSPGATAGTYTCDTVYEIRQAPGGGSIYVGGDFETVDGKQRPKLAQFDVASGDVTTFRVWGTNGRVRALAVTADRLYYGGSFTASDSRPRTRLASVDRATGAVNGWMPSADGLVIALALAPDESRVLVAGDFDKVNGVSIRGLAPVDAVTGASERWDTRLFPGRLGASRSYVTDLTVDGDTVYAAANGEGSFDGRVAFDPYTGQARWVDSCLGATWAVEVVGDVLYSGSHAHNCTPTTGGFPETWNSVLDVDDQHFHRLLAQTAREGTTTSILHWFPTTDAGIVGKLGPRDITHTARTVWIAGEFTTVNGVPQQGLTRFGYAPAVLRAAPQRPQPPLVLSDRAGEVEVRFEAAVDDDDENLTYTLFRGETPIYSTTGASKPNWIRPQFSYTDTALPPGDKVSYQVRATDPSGRASVKSWGSSVTVAEATTAYRQQVLADGAHLYWPLEEPNSRFAGSLATPGGAARYGSTGVTYRTASATPSIPGSAGVTLDGSSGRVRGSLKQQAPDVFTAEVWFKTSTTRGGKILGFGSSNTQRSSASTADRHVYMLDDGRLSFGVSSGGHRVVTSTQSYRDARWHHLAVSNGANRMRMYVDGALVAVSASSYNPVDYSGYWQLGGDNLGGWPSAPSSRDFAGSLDEFAVYPSELSATTLATHAQLSSEATGAPAPGSVTATPGNATATVSWTMPSTDADVTGFEVVRYPGGRVISTPATARSAVDNGLVNGTRYTYTVRSLSPDGDSVAVSTPPVVPATTPAAPRITSTTAGSGRVTVTWRAPASGGRAITSYQLASGTKSMTVRASVRKATLTRLPKNKRLRVSVRATNAMGKGAIGYSRYVRTKR